MVVIFIDIVGYKNITDFSVKYDLHRLFHEEVAIHSQRQEKISHVIYDRKVISFSDCAYFFFFYKDEIEDSRKDDVQLAYIAAYNVSLTMLRLMSKGFLARGGVALGDVFIDELSFFGPAVERAHEIESKEAIVPRLQFDLELGKRIFEFEHDLSKKDSDLINLYTEVPFVSDFEDNAYFVNPFNVLERSGQFIVGNDIITLEGVKKVVVKKVEEDLSQYSDEPRIVQKLEWIRKYILNKKTLYKSNIEPYSLSVMNIQE